MEGISARIQKDKVEYEVRKPVSQSQALPIRRALFHLAAESKIGRLFTTLVPASREESHLPMGFGRVGFVLPPFVPGEMPVSFHRITSLVQLRTENACVCCIETGYTPRHSRRDD